MNSFWSNSYWIAIISHGEFDHNVMLCDGREVAHKFIIREAQELGGAYEDTEDDELDEWEEYYNETPDMDPYERAVQFLADRGYKVYVELHDVTRIVM